MKKLMPFQAIFGKTKDIQSLSEVSVVVEENGAPKGFVFGRDAFIEFLEQLDTEFEERSADSKKAYTNPAGRLIDLIEDKLPLREEFVRDLEKSIKTTKKSDWIPLADVIRSLNV